MRQNFSKSQRNCSWALRSPPSPPAHAAAPPAMRSARAVASGRAARATRLPLFIFVFLLISFAGNARAIPLSLVTATATIQSGTTLANFDGVRRLPTPITVQHSLCVSPCASLRMNITHAHRIPLTCVPIRNATTLFVPPSSHVIASLPPRFSSSVPQIPLHFPL